MTKTCEERIGEQFDQTMADLRQVWEAYCSGEDEEGFYEYGLGFDYVEPDTFDDQEHGYFRYQLSWGGPSDEFRFYVDWEEIPYKIEYWFMDWFDGACIDVMRYGRHRELMETIFGWFAGMGLERLKA